MNDQDSTELTQVIDKIVKWLETDVTYDSTDIMDVMIRSYVDSDTFSVDMGVPYLTPSMLRPNTLDKTFNEL